MSKLPYLLLTFFIGKKAAWRTGEKYMRKGVEGSMMMLPQR